MIMALAEPVKKGGRYTKKQQEERRLEVHHLHFDEKKSAVEIAELLDVNRNTINEDIKFWYCQFSNQSSGLDINAKMIKQIQKMDIQRNRLLDDLEEVESLDDKIRLEKFISELDYRLIQFCSKAIFTGTENLSPSIQLDDIEEDEIKKFVRYLLFLNKNSKYDFEYTKDFLKFEFIRKIKCDVAYADKVIQKMQDYGLELCSFGCGSSDTYDLLKFADLRSYLTSKESDAIERQWEILIEEKEVDENLSEE